MVYIICKVVKGVIRRKRWPKSNKAFSKIRSTNSKNQQPILDTNNCKLKRPIPNDDQRIIATKTKEMRTITSTDTRLGAGEIQWINTRHGLDSDGMMNATIGEIRKAIEDDFNENVRRVMRSKQPEPRMILQPQNGGQSKYPTSGLNLRRQDCHLP